MEAGFVIVNDWKICQACFHKNLLKRTMCHGCGAMMTKKVIN